MTARGVRLPGHHGQRPGHQPDQPGGADFGDVTSFTGAQPARPATAPGATSTWPSTSRFPWFTSLTGESAGPDGVTSRALNEPSDRAAGTNCDANHVANLDDPTYGLVHDLSLPANEVPAFSWITPNNCSDAHDATCQGNNLSGAFNANGTPNYTPAGLPAYDPEATTPANYTGGLYAADLFLRYYIPLIEQSAAFKRRRAHRRHLRRGQPAVHHRQQLQQRQRLSAHLGGPAELHQLDQGRHRG